MGRQCLICGYVRKEEDEAPDYECPNCGRVYAKVEAKLQRMEEVADCEEDGGHLIEETEELEELIIPITSNSQDQLQEPNQAERKESEIRAKNVNNGNLPPWLSITAIAATIAVFMMIGNYKIEQQEAAAEAAAAAQKALIAAKAAKKEQERKRMAEKKRLLEERKKDPVYQAEQHRKAKEREEEQLKLDVASICQVAIRHLLHDPDSAEFDFFTNYRWSKHPGNKAWIFPTLRAKNAFGAYRKTTFGCEVDYSNRKRLNILSLEDMNRLALEAIRKSQ